MINTYDVLETIRMIQDDCLDIRTITMGISLLDCIDSDINVACENVYKKITAKAARLVEVGEQIEKELGIPIINKRISVTPIAIVSAACKCSPVPFAHAMDRAAKDVGVNLIGGYTALVPKGFSAGDIELIKSIPEALATTERVCSSVNIGSTKTGINLDACKMMGGVVRECAERTVDSACFGAAKLVVFCNAVEDNPFMAGAFHGVGEPDCMINVGVSGPGVVRAALRKYPDADITKISDVIKEISYKITRVGQLVGTIASKRLGVPFGIVDLSLAPTPAVGDSVAHILEEIGLEKCGISTAEDVFLHLINNARRSVHITTPYLAIDEPMRQALCSAGDSGVDVRLLLPGIPDHKFAYLAAQSHYGELLVHHVKIYIYEPGLLHGKTVLSDGEAAFVGSVNMDYRSFQLHFECGTVLYGVPAIEGLAEDTVSHHPEGSDHRG